MGWRTVFMSAKILVVLIAVPVLMTAQNAELAIHTDLECRLLVDGESHGILKPGADLRVSLSPGAHRFEATTPDNSVRWQQTFRVSLDSTQHLDIPLQGIAER